MHCYIEAKRWSDFLARYDTKWHRSFPITTSRRVIRLVLPGWEESGAYYPTIKRTTSDPGRVYEQGQYLINFPEVQWSNTHHTAWAGPGSPLASRNTTKVPPGNLSSSRRNFKHHLLDFWLTFIFIFSHISRISSKLLLYVNVDSKPRQVNIDPRIS